MDLTIIIVNHETPDLVRELVKSILKTVKNLEYEIIVVDNSVKESLCFSYNNSHVKVLRLLENKGFANASNSGANEALGECLLFLNSDSKVYENSIIFAYQYFLQHKKIGALGIKQLLADGSLDAGCKRGFPTPMNSLYYFLGLSKLFKKSKLFGSYQQTFIDEDSIAEVDCISGAYMLMRKSVFNLVGGFDESFFLYGEDVDLCYRLKQHGFHNIYYGKVYFTHLKSGSGAGNEKVLGYFYKSMEIFYDKHYKKKYSFLVEIMVKFAIRLKYFLARRVLIRKSKQKKR